MLYLLQYVDPLLLNITVQDRFTICQVIQEDVNFLSKRKLMDYSMLLAVEKVASSQPKKVKKVEDFFKTMISEILFSQPCTMSDHDSDNIIQ